MTFTIDEKCFEDLNHDWIKYNGTPDGIYYMIRNENGDCIGMYNATDRTADFFDVKYV